MLTRTDIHYIPLYDSVLDKISDEISDNKKLRTLTIVTCFLSNQIPSSGACENMLCEMSQLKKKTLKNVLKELEKYGIVQKMNSSTDTTSKYKLVDKTRFMHEGQPSEQRFEDSHYLEIILEKILLRSRANRRQDVKMETIANSTNDQANDHDVTIDGETEIQKSISNILTGSSKKRKLDDIDKVDIDNEVDKEIEDRIDEEQGKFFAGTTSDETIYFEDKLHSLLRLFDRTVSTKKNATMLAGYSHAADHIKSALNEMYSKISSEMTELVDIISDKTGYQKPSINSNCAVCLENITSPYVFTGCGHVCCLVCVNLLPCTNNIPSCPTCRIVSTPIKLYI